MERLTTDNPQNNFQTLMNYAYAKDGRVCLRHADGQDEKDLCEYIASRSYEMCGGVTPEGVMEGTCMECDCPLGILNTVATQAAELRGRLKAVEDILGPTYDLNRFKELVEADREGRVTLPKLKVGDTVYITDQPYPCEIKEIVYRGYFEYCWVNFFPNPETYELWDNGYFEDDDIGKDVFLTREAAKQALEEENG